MNPSVLPYAPEPLPLGAKTVTTQPFELVQLFGRQVLALGGIMLVSGPSGCGKTHAAKTMCTALGVRVAFLHLADRARGNEVLRGLLVELGEPADARGRELLDQARAALVGRSMVIFVDEAHLLNREALRQIRYLFDQPGMRFALVMTGVDFDEAFRLVPEFPSRVSRRVAFKPLRGSGLIEALRAHHPILAATEEAVLTQIDKRYAKGVWRHWEHVLITAAGYGATAQTGITRKVAAGVLSAIAGGG